MRLISDVLNDNQKRLARYLASQHDSNPEMSIFEIYGRLWVGDARVPPDVMTAFTLLSAEEQNTVGAYMALPF